MLRLLAAAAVAFAQDPYANLPKNYALEFENDFVRVSRVRYHEGDKLPVHSHPSIPTVYVYLNDAGAIRFSHKSTPVFTIERPPVKAGGVRFNRNAKVETHEVEYLGQGTAEYLRIEMKTVPGPVHRDARLKVDADFPWEDEMVRIQRIHGKPAPLKHAAVLIDIENRSFTWFDPGTMPEPRVTGDGARLIVVELKSGLPPSKK